MPDILMTRIDNRLVTGKSVWHGPPLYRVSTLLLWQMIWLLPTRCSKA